MKSTHLAIFTLAATSAATAPLHAFTTLNATDAFVVTPASGPGNLIISGDLTTLKGLDIGVSTVPTKSAIQLDWYNTAPLLKTATFDLTDATSTFLWRDNLTATARNKMKLDGANLLSLYNAAGTATPITLNGANGRITLSGNGSGLYSGNQPVLTLNAAGQPTFGANQPLAISNTTASTTPTTGALTLAGGLGVTGSINTTADAYINSIRIGRGGANDLNSVALGTGALNSNNTWGVNTAIGSYALFSTTSGAYNTAVGFAALTGNTTGGSNTAIGHYAGRFQADGGTPLTNANSSTYIGWYSRGLNDSDNNSIVIGANAVGKGANTTVIGTPATTQTHLFGKTITSGLEIAGGNTAPAAGQTAGGLMAAGSGTIASGSGSVAFGISTTASGTQSHVRGYISIASGPFATASGNMATAGGSYSFSNGWGTSANTSLETVFGRYNLLSAQPLSPITYKELDGLFRIGNGTTDALRSDAITTLKNGQTTLTNKAWKADPTVVPSVENSNAEALVVEGNTRLMGRVTLDQAQGDISMGIYQ